MDHYHETEPPTRLKSAVLGGREKKRLHKEKPASQHLQEISALFACIELMDDQFEQMLTTKLDTAKRFEIAERGKEYARRARERIDQIFYTEQ